MHKHLTQICILFMLVAFISTSILSSYALNWYSDVRLTIDNYEDFSPAITQTKDGKIWVFWHSYRISIGNAELFYKTYDGATWIRDTRLTFTPGHDASPTIITASDGKMWLFWTSNRTGDYNIYYRTSSNDGASWTSDAQVTTDPASDMRPSVTQAADGKIWIAWQSDRNGIRTNDDIFYKVYDGVSWSADTQITFSTLPDRGPSIMKARDGKIWLFWASIKDGAQYDIYYKIYDGALWSSDTQLTTNKNWDMLPSAIQARDGKIWVAYESDRSGTDDDIYYNIYDGTSWSSDAKLTGDNIAEDVQANLFQAENKTIWLGFASDRAVGDFDIYYKCGKPLHDAAITAITLSSVYAYRGYGIKIYVSTRNYGTATETFSITAYYDGSTPAGTQTTTLGPDGKTTLTIPWSATGVSSGNHQISASTGTIVGEEDPSDNSLTDGTIEVRTPGDINGDHIVNILDAILLVQYYGKYNAYPAGDINGDGLIDIFDAAILSANYGSTG